MKGRKPQPKAPQRGTARHRKPTDIIPVEHSGAITEAQAVLIPLPRSVPRTKSVKETWALLCREVARTELRPGDVPLLERMFVAAVRAAQCGAYIREHGLIEEFVIGTDKKTGAPILATAKNRMLAEERQQSILYDRLAQRFGLSPEARVRLDLMQIAGASLGASLRQALIEGARSRAEEHKVIEGELVDDDSPAE